MPATRRQVLRREDGSSSNGDNLPPPDISTRDPTTAPSPDDPNPTLTTEEPEPTSPPSTSTSSTPDDPTPTSDDPKPTSSSSSSPDDPEPTSSSSSSNNDPPASSSSSNNPPASASSSSDNPPASSSSSGNPPASSSSSSNDPGPTSSSSNNDPPASSSSSDAPPASSSSSDAPPASSSSSDAPPSSSSSSDDPPPASSSSSDPSSGGGENPTSTQGTQPAATETTTSDEGAVVTTETSSAAALPSDTGTDSSTSGEATATTTDADGEATATTTDADGATISVTGLPTDTTSGEEAPTGSESLSQTLTGSDVLFPTDPSGSLSAPSGSLSVGLGGGLSDGLSGSLSGSGSDTFGSLTVTVDTNSQSSATEPAAVQAGVSSIVTTIDGHVTTIMMTEWITTIGGQVVTITQTVPVGVHALTRGGSNGGAIIGGAIGGAAALLLVGLVAFFVWRRSSKNIANSHRWTAAPPANMSQRPRGFDLAGPNGGRGSGFHAVGGNSNDPFSHEDDDDAMLFPHAGSPTSAVMNMGPSAGPLLRPRGSVSGSIFHETGIWPPPSAASRLRDPLLSASELELGGIVDDVMGPGSSNGESRLRGGAGTPGDPFSDYASPLAPTQAAAFALGHNRYSSGSSYSGVTVPLLAAAATSAPHIPGGSVRSGTPVSVVSGPMSRGPGSVAPPSVRSRLALVTSATAGPSSNPFSDAKAAQATSQFRSGYSNASTSADGHTRISDHGSEAGSHGLHIGHMPPPGPPVGELVDLTPGQEAELTMPAELPPQYHTIRRVSDERRAAAEEARR